MGRASWLVYMTWGAIKGGVSWLVYIWIYGF